MFRGLKSMRFCAMMSIVFILLVGMSFAKQVYYHGNTESFQPIVSVSQSKRICAALCMSGLGGKSCGPDCQDLTPNTIPAQSPNSSDAVRVAQSSMARRNVCPILCKNGLGQPLCDCQDPKNRAKEVNEEIDFVQVCGNFCLDFKHRLPGCQSCKVYEEAAKTDKNVFSVNSSSSSLDRSLKTVDWEEWCRQMCSVGDGGAACNCDILPMSLHVD
ncbi:uncharacterized protein [Onthophagus taurus]|uniref:uncharacterized protein n=1 Tax=Onthophagus taurus TaxID=166361 RepID=UPI0039BE89A4